MDCDHSVIVSGNTKPQATSLVNSMSKARQILPWIRLHIREGNAAHVKGNNEWESHHYIGRRTEKVVSVALLI